MKSQSGIIKSTRTKSILRAAIYVLSLLVGISAVSSFTQQKMWTYDLKSVESDSTNKEMLNFDLQVERVSRGVYSLSGKFTMNYDVVEGDDNELEVTSYRSDNGIDNYKLLPFAIPRQHFFKLMNSFYKEMAMESLKDCSDMPQFEGDFVPPFEKKTYTLTKCQFSQDGYPQYVQDGFYKILVSGYGTVVWSLTVFVEVQAKSY